MIVNGLPEEAAEALTLLTATEQAFFLQMHEASLDAETGLVRLCSTDCPQRNVSKLRQDLLMRLDPYRPRWCRGSFPEIVHGHYQVDDRSVFVQSRAYEMVFEKAYVVFTYVYGYNPDRSWRTSMYKAQHAWLWIADRKEKSVKGVSRRAARALERTLLLSNL